MALVALVTRWRAEARSALYRIQTLRMYEYDYLGTMRLWGRRWAQLRRLQKQLAQARQSRTSSQGDPKGSWW